MKKFLLAAALLIGSAAVAFAQTSVQQSGSSVTRNTVPYWVSNGIIGSGVTSDDSPVSSFGVTKDGSAGICVSSDRNTAAGRNQLCFGASTAGAATISLQNYGNAAAQNLNFVVNGSTITLPTGGGAFLLGSGSFAAGNVPCFVSTAPVLQDCGLNLLAGGIVDTGTWQGTAIALAFGGTGASTASGARTALGLGTMSTQGAGAVAITGGTITGLPSPTNTSDAATKAYVDATSSGLIILGQSRLATAAILPNSPVYSNGSSGVGATLTAGSHTTLTVDGTVANLNDVVLVKNQGTAANNGIYTVTTAGDGSNAWVLTRATYFDQAAEILKGSYTFITAGSANINTAWVLQTTVSTVGSDAVNFNEFSSSGVASIGGLTGAITCGTGITCTSSTISSAPPVSGASTLPTPYNLYVDASTGNDSNDCEAATSGGGHGPCLTFQHTVNIAFTFDAQQNNLQINAAAGTYTTGFSMVGPIRGTNRGALTSGLVINGVGATTILDDNTSACGTIITSYGAQLILKNIKLQNTGAGCSGLASTMFIQSGSYVVGSTGITWGIAASQHIHLEDNAIYEQTADDTIASGASAGYHVGLSTGANYLLDGHTVTCGGAAAYTSFYLAQSGAKIIILNGSAFSGCGSVTGKRFELQRGAILDADGSTTLFTSIPGNAPGLIDNSSTYAPYPAPTLSACSTGSLEGSSGDRDDRNFVIGFGVGTSSTCTATFGLAKTTAASCVASSTSGTPLGVAVSASAVIVTGTFVNGLSVYVHCAGQPF